MPTEEGEGISVGAGSHWPSLTTRNERKMCAFL
jgi:hypothetical protein